MPVLACLASFFCDIYCMLTMCPPEHAQAAIMDYAGKCRFISRGVTEELPDVLAVISQVEAELEMAKAWLVRQRAGSSAVLRVC